MPLGEVLRGDPPAPPGADHGRPEVVDGERDDPHRDPCVPVEKAGEQDERGAEHRRRREPENRAEAGGIVAGDGAGEDEMEEADDEVRDAEEDCVVSEGPRHRQADEEHRARRSEHHEPDAALVDVRRARQPRVDAPRPPERREDEHPADDSVPRRIVRQLARHLRDREHEDEVEEELERGDLVLGVGLELDLDVGRAHGAAGD